MKTMLFVFSMIGFSVAQAGPMELVKSYLPNAVSIDLATNRTLVSLKDRDALTTDNKSSGGFLSSISVTSIPLESNLGFAFKWAPVFTFAFHRLSFESPSVFLRETDFEVFRTSLGVGPEISYTLEPGTFFANLTPGVSYSWVSWSSPLSGGSMAKFNSNLTMTLGFYSKLTKQMAVKLFMKLISEDEIVWKEALSSSQGFTVPVTAVTNSILGLSLAWIF